MTFWERLRRRFRPPRRLSFTREGKIIVVLSVGVGFAAINTGNNLLYLLLYESDPLGLPRPSVAERAGS